jgi:hypothetical protein
MDKSAFLNAVVTILVCTLAFVILQILTESPSIADIAVFAVEFAVLSAVTYSIVYMIMEKVKKKSK